MFFPGNVTWSAVTAAGAPPSPRFAAGCAAAADGRVYVYGGVGNAGDEGGSLAAEGVVTKGS